MKNMSDKIRFVYSGGLVKRYHTIDTIKTETVAEHSFIVAALVIFLGGTPTDVAESLFHDMAEQVTGDLPSTLKASGFNTSELSNVEEAIMDFHDLPKVTANSKRVIKIADILSGLLFCNRELSMGNKNLSVVKDNYTSYLAALSPFSEKEGSVITGVIGAVGYIHVQNN